MNSLSLTLPIARRRVDAVRPAQHFDCRKLRVAASVRQPRRSVRSETPRRAIEREASEPIAPSVAAPSVDEQILTAAYELHDCGFQVVPVPRVGMERQGKKPPYGSLKMLTGARLHRPQFPALFAGANLAVLVGRMSDNLFIVDCDSQESFTWVGAELARRGIAPWVSASVRGGHYWLRCAEGVVTSCAPQRDIDVKGSSGYVLCPPSVHPLGVFYEWETRPGAMPPEVSVAEMDFLSLHVERKRAGELPSVARAVLIEGDSGAYGGDNSAAEFAAVLSLLRVGYEEDAITALFEEYQPPHFAGKKDAATWLLRHVLPDARRIIASGSSSAPQHRPHAARDWALARAWPGRGGESDRCTFLALCRRAELERNESFRASLRELAELANLDKKTVQKALTRLIAAGHIQRKATDEGSGAACYALTPLMPHDQTSPTKRKLPCIRSGGGMNSGEMNSREMNSREMNSHDVWHGRALGKSALAFWTWLLDRGEMTAAAIAEATGRSLPTVRRRLAELERVALVRRVGQYWQGLDAAEHALDRIAEECGTKGAGETRRRKHSEERALRASHLLLLQKKRWEAQQAERESIAWGDDGHE